MNERTLHLEITSRGFLAGPPAEGSELPLREAVDLRLDTLRAWLEPCDELDQVVFTGPGEPLLHPRLAYLVRAARQQGASCVVETGGLVLEGRLLRDLIEAGLDELRVRLDAPTRDGYRELRHDDAFDKVIGNLAALADERKMLLARNPVVRVLLREGAIGGLAPRQIDRLAVTISTAVRAPGPFVSVTGDVYAETPALDARSFEGLTRLGSVGDRPLTDWEEPVQEPVA